MTAGRTVQRVLFPSTGEQGDVLPLYLDAGSSHGVEVLSRESVRVQAGGGLSLASYFGALPIGVWASATPVRRFRLDLVVEGIADVRLIRTDSRAERTVVQTIAGATGEVALHVEIPEGQDLGWAWAEVDATEAVIVRDARWSVPAPETPATGAVCITTVNREHDCIQVLRRLADDAEVRARLSAIIVVDQGSRRLRDAAGYAEAAAALDGLLVLIEQANLGGSGGFSRGMLEARERATHAILLDDDVRLETDSILRMLSLAEQSPAEIVVGGQMLSLTEPTLLHTMGERVDRGAFWWTPVDPALAPVDLATHPLAATPALHRVHEVDFNGWWMCAIPTGLIRRAGASLPLFLKWDDAEYGLRSADAGVRTVTLPGAALWHMPWTAKDDGLDWQAYFQLRGRLVTGLVHGARRRGSGMLLSSLAQDLNHVLCLQYGSTAVRSRALLDVLQGPAHLEHTLRAGPRRSQEILERFGQTVVTEAGARGRPGTGLPARPVGRAATVSRLAAVLLHQLRRPRLDAPVALTRAEGRWWMLGRLDAATVDSATGTGVFVARRDRGIAGRAVRRAIGLRVRLWLAWPSLSREYRAAAPRLASAAAWRARFEDADAAS
ncbi:glycosyltransferase [uncultured Microbacterium sp.]|uniref:glycosyltransferase n=1 Tax=uncultured Microbacterium sp. TaxID=191216 RepID=UPI0025DFF612|nr:glycosyltransferase [uncultured Microbacterium sp.]